MIFKVMIVVAVATYVGYEFLIRPKMSALSPAPQPVGLGDEQWPSRQSVL